MSKTWVRKLLCLSVFLCACSGRFSWEFEETGSSSSESGTSDGTFSSEESSSSSSESGTSSGTEITTETSLDPDTSSGSEGSSSSTGEPCLDVETCVPCQETPEPDAACAAAFPDRPFCGPQGACVECLSSDSCSDMAPVCIDGTCVGCAHHVECPLTACNLETGSCFDGSCLRHVDGDGGQDADTLNEALADNCVLVLHELAGEVPYTETTNVEGITVAILAAPGEQPTLQGVGGPSLDIGGGALVYLEGVALRGNTDDVGLFISNSDAYLDRVQITQNSGNGVNVDGGSLSLRNVFVAGNGGNSFSATTGIFATDASLEIVYTSLVFNEGDGADSVQCEGTTGTIRNSIVVGSDPSSFDCPGVSASYSAFDDTIAGPNNEDVSPVQSVWFVNPATNFHLTAAGGFAFADIALWLDRDPTTDIDGTEQRPIVPDSPDVAGADIP